MRSARRAAIASGEMEDAVASAVLATTGATAWGSAACGFHRALSTDASVSAPALYRSVVSDMCSGPFKGD